MTKIFRRIALLSIFVFPLLAKAQTTIVVSDPQRKFPIAVPQLCVEGGSSNAHIDIPRIIGKDLDLSGYFDVLNPASYIEGKGRCGNPNYGDWSVIKTEWLVKGSIVGTGPHVKVQMYLHDVPNQRAVLGKEYEGDVADVGMMANKFANEIMKFVTGESGPFGSKIVFSSRIGRFKDLFVMDMDGSNIRQLTNEKGLALSPAWDPAGQNVLYTSYRNRVPDLFVLDVASSHSRQLTHNSALEVGGAFTKDGRAILTSLTEDRDSDLVLYGLDGGLIRRLTPPNGAIDVSPSYSPDGSQITFCSDRGGRPQIYVMSSDGGDARRVSFVESNYCTSPVWSPKGDRIAFVCRSDGGFQTYLSQADGSNPIQLTSGGSNEDPDWSPDGRYLVFASTFGKKGGFNLAMMRVAKNLEGSSMSQISFSRGDDTEPTWGPVPQ
jgi:TolB protein